MDGLRKGRRGGEGMEGWREGREGGGELAEGACAHAGDDLGWPVGIRAHLEAVVHPPPHHDPARLPPLPPSSSGGESDVMVGSRNALGGDVGIELIFTAGGGLRG